MTIESGAGLDPAFEGAAATPAILSVPRPLLWSVRREIWEHRALYIAPAIAAGVALFGVLLETGHVLSAPPTNNPALALLEVTKPHDVAAAAIIFTGLIVGVLYCLGALHNERRDRSILFWKSLPVSDLTTVASKALIPLAVLPVILVIVVAATQLIMLPLSGAIANYEGVRGAAFWASESLPSDWLILVYCLAAQALWYAPIWGWLLLVSCWSRRVPFLWATLPLLAVGLIEKIALGTNYFGDLIKYRFIGFYIQAFTDNAHDGSDMTLSQIDLLRFLSAPGLWIGLAFAAAFLAGAVWLRRYREPL